MTYFQHFPRVDYDLLGTGFTTNVPNLAAFSRINPAILDDYTYYRFYNVPNGARPDNVSQILYGTPDYYWTFFLINDHLNNLYDDWPKGTEFFDTWLRAKYANIAATVPLTASYQIENTIAGKFVIGEPVIGLLSGARGVIVAKFPTLGFIEIAETVGRWDPAGESILGTESQDSVNADSIIPLWQGPHHHIDIATEETTTRRRSGTRPVSFLEYERERENENSRIRVIKTELIQRVLSEFRREMALQ